MKKRIVIIALALVCAICFASCQNGVLENGIEYKVYNDKCSVRDITIFAGEHVVIPAEYNGYPVTYLSDSAVLFGLPSIYKKIIIPETIEQISDDFYDCASSFLQYNEYDNAYYIGTEDNPYFALIKAKEKPTESAVEMSHKLEVDTENKNTPPTMPYEGNVSTIQSCVIHPDTKVIAYNAFEGCSYLESITVPGGIKIIPGYAFAGCVSLKTIILEEGVEFLSSTAFEGCRNVETITLPSTLKESEFRLFEMENLKSINIPDGFTKITEYMFYGCKSLEEVNIPSTVTYIGDAAFSECISLDSIEIPNGIEYIGEYAFAENKFSNVKIPAGLFEICDDSVFMGTIIENIEIDYSGIDYVEIDGSLYSNDLTTLYKYGGDHSALSFTVPDGVENIAEYAFKDSTLKEIVLPEKLERIALGAFHNCDGITFIDIPRGVCYLGEGAFYDCDALESFIVDFRIDDFRYSTLFASCDSLTQIIFEREMDYMHSKAFFDCPALESIEIMTQGRYYTQNGVLYRKMSYEDPQLIYYPRAKQDKEFVVPNDVEYIYIGAFKNNEYLEEITIAASVYNICENAFEGAKSLTTVNILATNLQIIEKEAFKNCVSLKEINFPSSLGRLGESAFEGCISLESVILNKNLKNIFENTFRDCVSLKSVELPEMLYFIEDGAFIGCTSLESITIPNYCLNIQGTVFEECVEIYYDGSVDMCGFESKGWHMFKNNCEDGFYIICTDGKYWHKR